jgi:hypothetical protein
MLFGVSAKHKPISPPTPLFLNSLNTLPLAPQILLPQTNLVITSADSQDIPAQAPANPPQNMIKSQNLAIPYSRSAGIRSPDSNRLVL